MIDNDWHTIDKGLRDLMSDNDSLSINSLKIRSRRLGQLSKFILTLKGRVDERIAGVKVGPIEPLFDQYFEARQQVDKNI